MRPLFNEIEKFRSWAATIPEDDRFGEWESNYMEWIPLQHAFHEYIRCTDYKSWDAHTISEILYIIARDNESSYLAFLVGENNDLLLFLSQQALEQGEPDAQWQLAARLGKYACPETERLLIAFVQSPDEYVSRIALMALADQRSPQTEYYCKLAWKSELFGEMQEYQRIAVLSSLQTIQSPLLHQYVELAKQDGREHLVNFAQSIHANK